MSVFSQVDIATSFKNMTMSLQKWQDNSKDFTNQTYTYIEEVSRFD